MEFEWDPEKNLKNIYRHGIPFDRAAEIFSSPCLYFVDTRRDYGEKRYNALGVSQKVVMNVTFVRRGAKTRIISARLAGQHERRAYREWAGE